MTKIKKPFFLLMQILLALCILGAITLFSINGYVVYSTADQILPSPNVQTADCILVLGCGVRADGTPTPMLADRLQRAIELYNAGYAPKLLMSGDHGQQNYDEVSAMKRYALAQGVPAEDIFLDHAGFSTYESIYRAQAIFGAERVIIVTQQYHLHRALYIANAFGLNATGVAADYRNYAGQLPRDIREILARNKDFLQSIFKPAPTFLGDAIPVFGDGTVTHD